MVVDMEIKCAVLNEEEQWDEVGCADHKMEQIHDI